MNFTIILLMVLFVIIIFMEYEQSKEVENYTIEEINRNHLYSFKKIDEALNLINTNNGYYDFTDPIYHFVYRPGSISENFKVKLIYLLSPTIRYINQITKSDYHISVFNKVIEQIDKNKNRKIVIDFHIVNTFYFYRNIRLNVEIIILSNGKNNINSINISDNNNIENSNINSEIDIMKKYPKKYSVPCRNNNICIF